MNHVLTHTEAKQILKNLPLPDQRKLRTAASARLAEWWPEDEGIGSSDVSIEAINIIRYENWRELLKD